MLVRFHGIAAGGDGVGRDENGRAIFAPFGSPGDVAEVVLTEEHRTFARARIAHLKEASPHRVDPPCPYYCPPAPGGEAPTCGGCQIQHLEYAAQLEAKRAIVRDALTRIGGIADPEVLPCLPSPLPFGYRNKADFVVGVESGRSAIGYFARSSHHLIDVEQCPLLVECNNELLTAVRTALAEGLVTPFDPATGRGVLRRVVVRTASSGQSLVLAVTTAAKWSHELTFARRLREQCPSLVGVLRREPRREARLLDGREWIEERLEMSAAAGDTKRELRWRVSGEAFFQVNAVMAGQLLNTVLEWAEPLAGQRVLDLFCGAGFFSLALAARGARVLGIEASPRAIADAKINAELNGLDAEFRIGTSGNTLSALNREPWDVVVLDPPRGGAALYLEGLLELAPRRIVYIACDPATLARDLKTLTKDSYRLVRAQPLDLFPQSAHVESVAQLERL